MRCLKEIYAGVGGVVMVVVVGGGGCVGGKDNTEGMCGRE